MFIETGNYIITSVKENGPITYTPSKGYLDVQGGPGTTVCSMSSKVLPAVDCILVLVPHFACPGLGSFHNSGGRRRHLYTH